MPPAVHSQPRARMPRGWVDRLLHARDRLLASRAFQGWAARFPLTRPVARRRARELFDLVAGFSYSQVLLACVQLNLFERLSERPLTLPEIASGCGLGDEAARRLLAAAVALRLLETRSGGRHGLGPLGAPLVRNAALVAMIEHHGAFYADLADPVALLRGERQQGRLAACWPYAGATDPAQLGAGSVAAYSTLMAASQPLVAEEILQSYPFARHRCLLDVGGGEAVFLESALRRAPRLQGILFDLPAVAQRARARLDAQPAGARARCIGGDFLRDALPPGADIATLVRVVHDHDDAAVQTLLRAVHAALPPGGTLIVAEPMAGTPGAQAMGDAYFGFYLLAMGSGRPRTPQALRALLESAGFEAVRLLRNPMPLQTQLIVARRPR